MERLGKWWKAVPKPIRQSLVMVFGTLMVLLGVALIPLPGPGWVIVFFGFAVLATEFTFAEKIRDWLITALKTIIAYAKRWFKSCLRSFKHKRQ